MVVTCLFPLNFFMFIRKSFWKRSFATRIQQSDYVERRNKILQVLPKGHTLVVPGFGLRYATGSIFYPFHQNTDLLYLSGFNEPNACMILNHDTFDFYVQPIDIYNEKWDGKRIGLAGAKELYGATNSFPVSSLEDRLRKMLESEGTILTDLPLKSPAKQDILLGTNINTKQTSATHVNRPEMHHSWYGTQATIKPLGKFIDAFRLIKSKREGEIMRESGKIAGRAFQVAMKATKPGMTEHQLNAILEFESKMQGATGLSYVPVVAGGKNALVLHYVQNRDVLKDGDLVLVDCGAEYSFYASDITRTWPVNGKFTKPQRQVYEVVLKVQKEMIKVLKFD